MTRARIAFSHQMSIDEPVVNLTPLIDVVFVILIMFIVIAPLLEVDKIELANAPSMPMRSTESVKEQSLITVHVLADDTLIANGVTVNLTGLAQFLKEARLKHPAAIPQIFHDKKAHFGVYQEVKNTLEEAGFPQMEIILKPV